MKSENKALIHLLEDIIRRDKPAALCRSETDSRTRGQLSPDNIYANTSAELENTAQVVQCFHTYVVAMPRCFIYSYLLLHCRLLQLVSPYAIHPVVGAREKWKARTDLAQLQSGHVSPVVNPPASIMAVECPEPKYDQLSSLSSEEIGRASCRERV